MSDFLRTREYFSSRSNAANVYELQSFLRYISRYVTGISRVVPDGIYGGETEKAVREFQLKAGLPATGEADFDTWTAIVDVYDELFKQNREAKAVEVYPPEIEMLKSGDSFEEIYVLQVMLRRLSKLFENIAMAELTGVYDAKTAAAVSDFARAYGREGTDSVDRELWNIMTDTYNTFTRNV